VRQVQQVGRLQVHAQELNHLAHGKRLLPPDARGVHGHEVVGVHAGVHQPVQDHCEVHIAVKADIHVQPVELQQTKQTPHVRENVEWGWWSFFAYQEDTGVVVDVEEAELLPLLLEYDEHSVHEI
jgi:hypothetical protein